MFLTAFDEAYAKWGAILLKSLAQTHVQTDVVVLGVDLSQKTERQLRRQHERCIFRTRSTISTGSRRAAAIANARPMWLHEITNEFSPNWIMLLDADLLFRRPIIGLIESSGDYDAALAIGDGLHRGRFYKRLKIAAGFALFRRSGFHLIDEWRGLIAGSNPIEDVQPGDWFWEQICLCALVEQTKSNILPIDGYLDSTPFIANAPVWSANGPPSEKARLYDVFMAEAARIMPQAN
jgi:hypothetical protein